MKKSLLALALVGVFAVSCGEKKTENKEVQNTDAATEQTTEVAEQKELTHTLEWTAFKTPKKVGVKGSFTDIQLIDAKSDAATLAEGLKDAKFVVNTASVSTNDAGRDEKLKGEFFAKMVGNINGFFGEFKDGKVKVSLTMNGVTKEKEFTYTEEGTAIKINGSIDIVADFTAKEAFDSLHQACKDLHEGKTWSDVEIAVTISK
ncbi:MAG: YceI family protein [Flavobacteriaceae bacterium]|jgi:polyisoprenoid-binding protein YceI|nr:YceI family protein [Flavobacteriaceae bacterium]